MELLHCVYEPEGEGPHPTILALHGRGANAQDLLGLAPHLCGGVFRVICPQAPLEVQLGPGMTGYAWFPMSLGGDIDTDAFLSARDRLRTFVDQCVERYPLGGRKLTLLGFSQGGGMAYSLGLSEPDRFAGMCVLSSWLREGTLSAMGVADRVDTLSTLVQHGNRDELIELARAKLSIELLEKLRVPVEYREYDMGHEINSRSLGDLSGWLQEKVLG
jgi:phospholipase/carboxylesterase